MNRAMVCTGVLSLAVLGCRDASSPVDVRRYPLYSEALHLLRDSRPFEYRFNGSRRHSACLLTGDSTAAIPGTTCRNGLDDATLQAAATLAARARSELVAQGSIDAMWTTALLDLALSDSSFASLERVLTRLNEVIARDSANPAARNDVTIAYARRAELRGNPGDLFLSLESAQRTFEAGQPTAPVLFNRGLALERVSFVNEASKAWRRLLQMSDAAGWEEETRRRAELLEGMSRAVSSRDTLRRAAPALAAGGSVAALARSDAEGVRLFITDDLLPRWGELLASGNKAAADSVLTLARRIAQTLAASNGDATTLLAIGDVERAGAHQPAVAAALRSFGEGSRLHRSGDFSSAAVALEDARRRFERLRPSGAVSPALTEWAALLLASTRIYAGDYAAAEALHNDAFQRLGNGAYPALRGRAHWGVAIGTIRQNALAVAITSLSAAVVDFTLARESSSLGAVQGLLLDAHFVGGQTSRALGFALEGLRSFRSHRQSPYLHNSLVTLGVVLAESGLPVAANLALREDSAVAVRTGRTKDPAEVFARLAHSEARLGRVAEATALLRRADSAMTSVADPVTRPRIEIEIAQARAEVLLRENPERAMEFLDRIVAYFEALGSPANLAPAMKNRGRVRLLAGDTSRATVDLQRSLELVEHASRNNVTPASQASLRATRGELFELLIGVAIARGDSLGAFELSERARPSAGLRSQRPGAGVAPSASPPHLVLAYFALERATALWVIGPAGTRLVVVPIGRRDLDRRVERFNNLLRHASDLRPLDELSGELYDNLLGPVDAALDGVEEVWIIPDRSLHQLPFALLRKRSSTEFAIERVRLRYLPSARSRPDLSRPGSLPRLLAVDGSAFDRTGAGSLALLGAARGEARSIAALYPGSTLLEGQQSKKPALLSGLPAFGMLHFAGHARSIRGSPARSFLLLTQSAGGSGASALTGEDLATLDLSRLRLAVLSSCGSDAGVSGAPGEENGIAHAFLAAGAGSVVSSLWEAEDAGTAAFMIQFHTQMRNGAEAAEALRLAQLDMLRRSESPYSRARIWGAFRLEHRQSPSIDSSMAVTH